MTPRKSEVILFILWVHAFIVGTGPFYCGRWYDGMECLPSDVMQPAYTLPALMAQYFLYVSIMIILYGSVFYVAHQQKLKINATIGTLDNNTLVKDTKTAKTLAVVLGVFLFCWTPFFCLATIQASGFKGDQLYTVYVVTILMGVFNSCLNHVIYCWKSSEFRKAFARLIKKLCRKDDF